MKTPLAASSAAFTFIRSRSKDISAERTRLHAERPANRSLESAVTNARFWYAPRVSAAAAHQCRQTSSKDTYATWIFYSGRMEIAEARREGQVDCGLRSQRREFVD